MRKLFIIILGLVFISAGFYGYGIIQQHGEEQPEQSPTPTPIITPAPTQVIKTPTPLYEPILNQPEKNETAADLNNPEE